MPKDVNKAAHLILKNDSSVSCIKKIIIDPIRGRKIVNDINGNSDMSIYKQTTIELLQDHPTL